MILYQGVNNIMSYNSSNSFIFSMPAQVSHEAIYNLLQHMAAGIERTATKVDNKALCHVVAYNHTNAIISSNDGTKKKSDGIIIQVEIEAMSDIENLAYKLSEGYRRFLSDIDIPTYCNIDLH